MIRKAATKARKKKPSFILETVDEKLGLYKSREQVARETAGWLTHEEAENQRQAGKVFDQVKKKDWA
jgi:hypothetical protein